MKLQELAEQVGAALQSHQIALATAESCTGGWVAREITAVPGSSHWFDRGFITYTNLSKQQMLGVSPVTIESYGAVSEQTVCEMASGAIQNSEAAISVGISGIAGPGGGSEDKPVGTVCMAWAREDDQVRSKTEHFQGDRESVREQAVAAALQGILDMLV